MVVGTETYRSAIAYVMVTLSAAQFLVTAKTPPQCDVFALM